MTGLDQKAREAARAVFLSSWGYSPDDLLDKAIAAYLAVLPSQEPVAWIVGRLDRTGAMTLRLPLLRDREEMERYQRNNPDETLIALYSDPHPAPAAGMKEWRCFHCDEVFTEEHSARLHFGRDDTSTPACQIKVAEGGLVKALRRAENDAAEAWHAIHSETTDAAKAYAAQRARHQEQLLVVEEESYAKGLADGRTAISKSRVVSWLHGIIENARLSYAETHPDDETRCRAMAAALSEVDQGEPK